MSASNIKKTIAGVIWPLPGRPTVEDLLDRYSFKKGEIDEDYGMVVVDPSLSYYAFLVSFNAFNRVKDGLSECMKDELTGPWSNPEAEDLEEDI